MLEPEYDELIVLHHGIDSPLPASKSPLSNVRIALIQQSALRRAFILESLTNRGRTLEGIPVLAQRLVDEIDECVTKLGGGTIKISIISHSLGGIVSRYAAFLLYERGSFVEQGGTLEPVSFMTLGTPHLGVMRSGNFVGRLAETAGELMFGGSKTLDELMMRDRNEAGLPLLVRMASGSFLMALHSFPYRTLVSAIQWDHQVTFSSSSITLYNQYSTQWALVRYCLSYVSSSYHDRLVGFSGFPDEYSYVLQYNKKSKKRLDTAVPLEKKGGDEDLLITGGEHAITFRAHPNMVEEGDAEIAATDPFVVACARGLQVLHWRRIDFELMSLFAHDHLINKPSVNCCGLRNPTRYGWKILNKLAKVIALDRELYSNK